MLPARFSWKRGAHRLAWIQDKDILVSTHLVASRRGSHAHVTINQSEKEIVGLLCYADRPAAQQTALLDDRCAHIKQSARNARSVGSWAKPEATFYFD
jgi:hypothetical protein